MTVVLPYLLDHCAIGVSAIGGVLAARGKQVDLFGVIVLALVTALGGGTIRDIALGDLPVLWIRDSNFLLTGTAAGVVTFFVAERYEFPRRGLLVADAGALALYTVVGASKALAFHTSPPAAVALGVVTGVAGGMIRDVLLGEMPMVFRREIHFYATAAFCGALVFVTLSPVCPIGTATIGGVATTLVLRLLAIRWKLGLPLFQPKRTV